MEVLVLGGTGLAGRAVCAEAIARGHVVRTFARNKPSDSLPDDVCIHLGDVLTGAGLHEATAGVDGVIDCTNIQTVSRDKATRFFTAAVRNAAVAAGDAGVGSYVLLSIVGVDKVPLGYYQAKLEQERVLVTATSGSATRPTVVRTTQFHDFAVQTLARAGVGPLVLAPSMRIRPVDLSAVARHLVTAVEDPPGLRASELAGPREESLPDMVRRLSLASGRKRLVVPVPLPGPARKANKRGLLIPGEGARDEVTFQEWLDRERGTR